jgi:hypothetical protein
MWLASAALLGALVASAHAQAPQTQAEGALPVALIGATAEGYKLTQPVRDLSVSFRIDRTDGLRSNLEVEIAVANLGGAPNTNRVPVTLLLDNQVIASKATIPPGGAWLTVSATLPDPATYTSQIRISAANKKALVVPLQIVRSRAATPLEFKDLDIVPGQTGRPLTATFSLRETAGHQTTFYTPDVSGLARILGGKRVSALLSATPVVSRLKSDDTTESLEPGRTLEIGSGATQRFTVALPAVTEAGEYGGTLHVTSPDGAPVDSAMTLLVHDPTWLAVALIVLGVVLSMLLRWYYQTKRPEMVRSHTALEVLKQLDSMAMRTDIAAEAKAVIQSLTQRVQRAFERIRLGEGDTADAAVTDVKAKLELLRAWLDASTRVAALGDSPVAPPLRKKVEDQRAVLLSASASASEIAAAMTALQAIPGDIQAALVADFNAALGAIESALQKRPAGAGHAPAVRDKIAEVQRLVDRARQEHNGDRLPQARDLVTAARKQYVRVLADEMHNAVAEVPLGYDAPAWTPIAREIGRVLDTARNDGNADRAWSEYNEARRQYVRGLLRGLRKEHGEVMAIVGALRGRDPNDAAAAESAPFTDAAATAITNADTKLESDLDAALDSARDADEEMRAAEAALEKRGVRLGGATRVLAAFFRPAGVPALVSIDSPDALSPLPRQPAITLDQLRTSIDRSDFLVGAVIAAIAVFLGLKTLLFGSLTWGGYADWAGALLWGLGLHQVSFDGVNNLAQKLSK